MENPASSRFLVALNRCRLSRRGRLTCQVPIVLVGFICLLAAWAPDLQSDVVHLKSGGRLEGDVEQLDGGDVKVALSDGSVVRCQKKDIERIDPGKSPRKELSARLKRLPAGELNPLVELLVWAREKRLTQGERRVAERILKIDEHHPLARRTLGYAVFQNRRARLAELRKTPGLVRYQDKWMTVEEKEARVEEEAAREIREFVIMAASTNRILRRYALDGLKARLKSREPVAVRVVGEHLDDERPASRVVALVALAQFTVKGVREAHRVGAEVIVGKLHRLALEENNAFVRKALAPVLARFQPRASFRLALAAARSADSLKKSSAAPYVRRNAGILLDTLRKAWVPELCRAVQRDDGSVVSAVHLALKTLLKEDVGSDAVAWRKLWDRRQGEFQNAE